MLYSLASGFSTRPFHLLFMVLGLVGPTLGCNVYSASEAYPEDQ